MKIDIDDVTPLFLSFFFAFNLTFLGTSSTPPFPFFLYSFLVLTVRHRTWREEWSQDELRCFRTRTGWILVKALKNNNPWPTPCPALSRVPLAHALPKVGLFCGSDGARRIRRVIRWAQATNQITAGHSFKVYVTFLPGYVRVSTSAPLSFSFRTSCCCSASGPPIASVGLAAFPLAKLLRWFRIVLVRQVLLTLLHASSQHRTGTCDHDASLN
jgi:hypothetical protein